MTLLLEKYSMDFCYEFRLLPIIDNSRPLLLDIKSFAKVT